MYELISKQLGADYFQQRFPNDGQRFVAIRSWRLTVVGIPLSSLRC